MKKKSHRFSLWDNLLTKFRVNFSPLVMRLAAPIIWLRRRLRPHKISLCRIEGTVNGGTEPLSLICGTFNQNKNYLMRLVFGGERREADLGQVRLLDVFRQPRAIARDSPLVILQTKRHLHEWLDDGSWFYIPVWVTGEVALPVSKTIMRHDSIQSTYRRIRKQGFEYEVTRDEERFKDFFHNMYLPFITRAHGDTAFLDPYDERLAELEISEIVLLRKRAQPDLFIAAFLIVYEPAGPRLRSVGVRDGNMEYVQEGVLAALYIFCFEHLHKKGFKHVNMGGSRPFLRDGVLKFKRKHSQTVTTGRWDGFSLKILSLTPAVKTFLVNNPFIFLASGRLHGAVFTDTPLTGQTVRQLDHEYYHPGLAKLIIYTLNEPETFTTAGLPPELAARIEIRRAADFSRDGSICLE